MNSISFKLFRQYLEVDKDYEEENEWQNLFDKRTRCIFLLNSVDSYSESIRSKIFRVEDIELLERMRLSLREYQCNVQILFRTIFKD